MGENSLIKLYGQFEDEIIKFRKEPYNYDYKVKNYNKRAFDNSIASFVFWFIISAILNILAVNFFFSVNTLESASLISISFLFLTIFSRSTTLNFFLYKFIGNMGKLYMIHQFTNRIGFFHRFMATSTIVWLFIFINLKEFKAPYLDEILLLSIFCSILLIIFSASSFFRRKNHNIFENAHRYLGYFSFLLLCMYFCVSLQNVGISFGEFIEKPHFYILLLTLMFLIGPWLGVKRINPKLVHVGPHVVGIQIEGKPSFGTYSSLTLANSNFHPFGDSMYDFDDMKNRTLYMTPAGDRTKQIVTAANNGEHILKSSVIKNDRKCGFMYHHAVYDSILIVVTGGGIAPIVPCLVLNDKTKIVVLWICHSPVEEFTQEVLEKLTNKIKHKEIYLHILNSDDSDLKSFKTPTYTSLVVKACKHYDPEAVFVMSNQKFTINMMHSVKENGYNAYGANFDS